jgi:hypothetical protein
VTVPLKRAFGLLCAIALATGLSACTEAVSTVGFKGEAREVAQTIANLQSDVTAVDEQKICSNDLASAVVARLSTTPGGCKQALKGQLDNVDNPNLTVESVKVTSAGATASARVESTYAGKTKLSTLSLVKEGRKWKISGLG